MKWACLLLLPIVLLKGTAFAENELSLAVEFNSHAAAFYVALDKGFFDAEGLRIKSYEAFLTGPALASALKKENIEAAYMCVHPAIAVYANGGVKLKIVSGTHLYGYGLSVNPKKIKSLKDLERSGIKIGCVGEGSGTDLIMRKMIEKYGFNEDKVLSSVFRMSPPNMLCALRSGSIDAAFLPEHFLTLAEKEGFKVFLTARDVWPNFQGSVIVVKEEVMRNKEKEVKKLSFITKKATQWINTHREDAAKILSKYLSLESTRSGFTGKIDSKADISISDSQVLSSMSRLEYTTKIEKEMVQEIIDFMAKKGYLRERFQAEKILSSF